MPNVTEILEFMLLEKKLISYADYTRCIDRGIQNVEITGVKQNHKARPGHISWTNSTNEIHKFQGSLLICPETFTKFRYVIPCKNPKLAIAEIMQKFFQQTDSMPRINFNKSTITNTECGLNITIGPYCCIGMAGQGYANKNDDLSSAPTWVHFPHVGKVEIHNNVTIGANTVICRGTIGNTIIGQGTKIGNLVNIGHNVKIGHNVMIIAGAVICGSVEIGNNAWIGPSATILNKIKIGKNAMVGIGSVVTKNVPDSTTVVGNPARRVRIR